MEENQVHIPEGWIEDSLGNILNYEQPYNYTVDSTAYNDSSGIPVLTAGKSFKLGYTNEYHNVYRNTPVIIFDDFTTDSKFVDFPFKVKSSAMKFLKPKNPKELDIKVIYGHIQNLKIRETGGDHKRRWISEFSKLKVVLPPFEEQIQIASILSKVDEAMVKTKTLIDKYSRIKKGLMHDLLTKGIDKNGNIRNEETHPFKDSPLGRIPKEWKLKKLGLIADFKSGYAFRFDQLTEFGIKIARISNLHKPDFTYWHYDGPIKENWVAVDGDILFTWAGVASSIDCIKYKGEKVLLNQHIYNFKFQNDSIKELTYRYLLFFLPKLRMEIEGGAGQLYLTKDKIQSILIPIINPVEMDLIIERLIKMDFTIQKMENQLSKLQSIKKGLMQDLLSGKVRVNNLIKETESV